MKDRSFGIFDECPSLREHIPLKQGLRLSAVRYVRRTLYRPQRAYSIKTRIKTHHSVIVSMDILEDSESIFH